MTTIDPATVLLRRGPHDKREDGMCAMEFTAFLAGRDHTDEPPCVCPVLTRLVIRLNDAYAWSGDEARTAALECDPAYVAGPAK